MLSMASWSPSQSAPFDVSYMCQRAVVLAHVAERRRDAALGRDGMRAGRKHLVMHAVQAGSEQPTTREAPSRRPPDHHHVVAVILDRAMFGEVGCQPYKI